MTQEILNYDRLLKIRLIVARFGEMDIAKWWNTKGQLGRLGATAIRRGFPRTHFFAQARSVFAVAGQRSREVFDPPDCVTLWNLPQAIEEEFEVKWEHWLDHATEWTSFFQLLETFQETDLKEILASFKVVTTKDIELSSRLRRTAEGRAVLLPDLFSGTDQDIAMLALGFARGEPGALAVPYSRRGHT